MGKKTAICHPFSCCNATSQQAAILQFSADKCIIIRGSEHSRWSMPAILVTISLRYTRFVVGNALNGVKQSQYHRVQQLVVGKSDKIGPKSTWNNNKVDLDPAGTSCSRVKIGQKPNTAKPISLPSALPLRASELGSTTSFLN